MKLNAYGVRPWTRGRIKKILECAATTCGWNHRELEASLSFVGKEEIRRLNRENRNVDKPTDVLSFPTLDNPSRQPLSAEKCPSDVNFETGLLLLGDVVVCRQVAEEQAAEYGHSLRRELCFLSLHGFLHLLGYDHKEEEEEKQMTELQRKILESCGVNR